MRERHVHLWRVVRGGAAITNSEPSMRFRVCRCGACEQISYAEAVALTRPTTDRVPEGGWVAEERGAAPADVGDAHPSRPTGGDGA